MIYSFDVFDTLITRLCSHPDAIFNIIQKKLTEEDTFSSFDSLLTADFLSHRKHAEYRARRKYHNDDIEDVTIVQIYEQLQIMFSLDDSHVEKLLLLELQVEYDYSVPIDFTVNDIRKKLSQGEKVILISDMYLRASDVKRLISKHAPDIAEACPLYVSSEIKKTKHKGSLFSHVLKDLGIAASQLMHTGDNDISDIRIPEGLGIKSILYDAAPHYYDVKSADMSIHEGVLRYMKMIRADSLGILACKYAMPMLLGFVDWLNKTLPKNEPVLFLARDGELLLQLMEWTGLEQGNFKYCVISRQAAVFASFNKFDQDFEDYLFQGYPFLSFEIIAERLHMSISSLSEILHFPIKNAAAMIAEKDLTRLKKVLSNNSEFSNYILQKSAEQKKYLETYLNTLNDMQDEYHIVDLGWQGTIQKALEKIFDKKISTYYFGMTEILKNAKAYYFFPSSSISDDLKRICIVFSELFCTSEQAAALAYDKNGPVYAEQTNKKEWLKTVREAFKEYMQLLKITASFLDWSSLMGEYIAQLANPDTYTAHILGRLEYSADPLDRGDIELAPKLKWKDLFNKRVNNSWLAGRLKRTNPLLRLLFKLRFAVFSFLRKGLRIIKR